jgi:hypothetical protein
MVADVQVAIVGGERQLAFNGRPPDERVQELIAQLCADPGFRSLWERDPDQFEGDSSRYDFRITARAIRAGLTDDEARAVGVANRLIHNPGDAKAEREDYWARTIAKAREGARSTAQATSDQPPRGERNYEIDFDPKGGLVLPDPPAVDDIGGHCRWLTAAFGLDRAHPITGGLRLGMRGDEGHVVLFRAGAEEIRFEPVKKINTPMRLVETLSWQTLPADSGTLSYKAVHCQRIAHVVRMLCGVSEQVTEAAEAEAILETFLQSAVPVEGTTTYGPTQDRYAAALALRRPVDEATARPLGQPRYLIDAHSGELVVGVSDLESSARWHVGSTVARGWLLARMEAIGWQRIKLDGHEKAGRNDRGNHARIQAYRGRLREGAEDG